MMSLCFVASALGQTVTWRRLNPGIEYLNLHPNALAPWSQIHAFRIDLTQNQLGLKMAKGKGHHPKTESVDTLAKQSNALIAINGGFFSQEYLPLGLRITAGKLINPLRNISWWGVLYTRNQKAHLVTKNQFKTHRNIDFAIQSGPRLIINNRIPRLKAGNAERSAIGITDQGEIILLATQHYPIDTKELAQLMRAPPLNCRYALNLDGGSSTQLYANIDDFKLHINSFSKVADAIIIKSRS